LLTSSRLRRIGGLVVASFAVALLSAPGADAALAGGYTPRELSEPAPVGTADGFGGTIVTAGGLVLVGVPKANGGDGAIAFINPLTGESRRLDAPLEPSHIGASTNFGASVAVIPDIGKCLAAPAKRGAACTASPTRDGIPDYLVGAPGADINSGAGVDMGRVYLFDGSTDGLMKRIQIGPSPANTANPVPGAPAAGKPDFGRSVASISGLPPCAGSGGIGDCPALSARVANGDIDGDPGQVPDLAIGAPRYRETADSNPACVGPPVCEPTGRFYVFKGEDLTGPGNVITAEEPSPNPPCLTSSCHLVFDGAIPYPYPQETSSPPAFGEAISPLGDIGSCDVTGVIGPICPAGHARSTPDGVPDLLVSGPGVDSSSVTDVGAAFVIDGASGTILERIDSPAIQHSAGFSTFGTGDVAAGDLGGGALPDIYVGAPGYDGGFPAQGRAFVFTGDSTLTPAAQLIASADDPTPSDAGNFGAPVAPAGNIAADAPGEVVIGESGATADGIHIFSACANRVLQTISAPGGASGFGNAVASLGDVDGDGYVDFAVGAPNTSGGAGRVFIMLSNGTPGPAFAGCNPGGGGDPGGGGPAGGGGSTGGGSTGGGSGAGRGATPRKRGKAVSTLAKRRIQFDAAKKKVKVAAVVTFNGMLRASKRKSTCQGKQKIAIQRYQPSGGFWVTVDVAVTDKKGKFTATARPAPALTFFYRAHVNQTKRCTLANSARVKIKATA
jgi:FG-GAP repeat